MVFQASGNVKLISIPVSKRRLQTPTDKKKNTNKKQQQTQQCDQLLPFTSTDYLPDLFPEARKKFAFALLLEFSGLEICLVIGHETILLM